MIKSKSLLILFLLALVSCQQESSEIEISEETQKRCFKVLREGLTSDEFWPSIHAAEALTLAGKGYETRDFLEPRLDVETDDQKRCGLARELVRAGDGKKASVMLRVLDGDDPHGHVHAAESLYKVKRIGDGDALEAAFEQTENLKLRLMAAAALARQGDDEAMAALRESMKSDDPEEFKIAAWILGRIGDESDIELLRSRLEDAPNDLVRAYLHHSMAALGDEEALTALEANLSSGDPAIRTYAATFAGDAMARSLTPRLIEMLDDPHLDARIRAAQTLLIFASSNP